MQLATIHVQGHAIDAKARLCVPTRLCELPQDLLQAPSVGHAYAPGRQFPAQQVGLAGRWQGMKMRQHDAPVRGHYPGAILRGDLICEFGGLLQVYRSTCQRCRHIRKHRRQSRQDLVPHEIPAQANIVIALVLYPLQRIRIEIGSDRCARQIEERTQQCRLARTERTLGWHACQPVHPGAPAEIEQQGFGLVVAMMRKSKIIHIAVGEGRIAGLARGPLKSFSRR